MSDGRDPGDGERGPDAEASADVGSDPEVDGGDEVEIDPAQPEHVQVYLRVRTAMGERRPGRDARRRARRAEDQTTVPFGPGREPHGIDAVLDRLTTQLGWESPLARSELMIDWPGIVGADTAQHSEPVGVEEGTLTVRCDSTAWAKQLGLMRSSIVAAIEDRHPLAGVGKVRILGPDTPSWKHGPRAVPGRGPRDTYG
ncbi:DUF721 domain-containing protein [Schumannella soli]|uniref:DUF721 domain-containing protein n=2 Tax=Schumannella soli TaxID=2590779 RepID=A0A506Y5C8_9MICO|nr:DciA family protein [Schumannella soli]TPW77816.1 DUF721 domain-containing protein [Schumannella soli]